MEKFIEVNSIEISLSENNSIVARTHSPLTRIMIFYQKQFFRHKWNSFYPPLYMTFSGPLFRFFVVAYLPTFTHDLWWSTHPLTHMTLYVPPHSLTISHTHLTQDNSTKALNNPFTSQIYVTNSVTNHWHCT